MTTISMPAAIFFEALEALREAIEDVEADNNLRAFGHLKRAQDLLNAAIEPELLQANG